MAVGNVYRISPSGRGIAAGPGRALLLFLALALGACSTTGSMADCNSGEDPMTGATFQWCGETGIFADETPMRADADLVRLLPVRAQLGDVEYYYVRAQFQGREWLYIPRDSELQLNIDGQSFSLKSPNGSRPDSTREVTGRYGVAVQESADYRTDAGIIRAIGAAKVVDLKLTASNSKQVEGRLSGPTLAPFQEFVERYLDN